MQFVLITCSTKQTAVYEISTSTTHEDLTPTISNDFSISVPLDVEKIITLGLTANSLHPCHTWTGVEVPTSNEFDSVPSALQHRNLLILRVEARIDTIPVLT